MNPLKSTTLKMVNTRLTRREITPPIRTERSEHTPRKRQQFYNTLDDKKPEESIRSIEARVGIAHGTAQKWITQRKKLGRDAYYKTRKLSKNLGANLRHSPETYKRLASPDFNPVRDQAYEAQIEYHHLHIKPRQLGLNLRRYTKEARRYKQAYVKKRISPPNKQKRVQYGYDHIDDTIEEHWSYILFTDEFHVDPAAQGVGHILREQGTRYDPENIQERPALEGSKLHVAGWINWHAKAEKLEFYNDEEAYIEKPKRPRKPRRRKAESDNKWERRLAEWQASIGHEKEVKPKGNAMTQKYYVERLLPVYCNALQKLRAEGGSCLSDWLLQEDGDPSHGMRKHGLAGMYKEANWIPSIIHPPQSPDPNPIEGVWCILKQRIRKRQWHSLEELKEVLQDEWSKITMEEVRARIREMPARCKQVITSGGKPIKSDLW
jgi:hypothetical protein